MFPVSLSDALGTVQLGSLSLSPTCTGGMQDLLTAPNISVVLISSLHPGCATVSHSWNCPHHCLWTTPSGTAAPWSHVAGLSCPIGSQLCLVPPFACDCLCIVCERELDIPVNRESCVGQTLKKGTRKYVSAASRDSHVLMTVT